MKRSGVSFATVVVGLVALWATAASAQFDPLHNHLQCYRIKSPTKLTRTVTLNDQFGTNVAAVLSPVLLCTPTQKTCNATTGCGQDPEPPVPVRHFKCYKVKVRNATLPKSALLTDQFGTDTVRIGAALLLCTPTLKSIVGETTTTTSTTTTTTLPFCHLDATVVPAVCGGFCPDPTAVCTDVPGVGCRCVSPPAPCGPTTAGTCGGLCPDPTAICTLTPNGCQCVTSTIPCGQSAPPACGGACPAGTTCKPGTVTPACACS